MEDNFTSKNTVDQAWGMMRSTLDNEMPVSKNSRFMWWTIPAGAILALFGFWYFFTSDSSASPTSPKHESPNAIAQDIVKSEIESNQKTLTKSIAKVNDSSVVNNTTKTEVQKASDITVESNAAKESKATKNNVSAEKLNSKKIEKNISVNFSRIQAPTKSASIGPSSELEKVAENTTLVIKSERSNNNIESTKIDMTNLANRGNTVSVETVVKAQDTDYGTDLHEQKKISPALLKQENEKLDLRMDRIIQTLDVMPAFPLDVEEESTTMVKGSLPVAAAQKKWEWSLRPAVTSSLNLVMMNYQLEVNFSRRISDRWTLGSGVGYKFQQFKLKRYNNLKSRNHDSFGAYDPSLTTMENLTGSNQIGDFELNGEMNNLLYQYLYVPVVVNYKFKNRWMLMGGANYNIIMESESIKNHFDFHISPAYRLTTKMAIGMQIQHSTKRISESRNEPGRNQLGVFLNYQL